MLTAAQPLALPPMAHQIPPPLREGRQWVNWRYDLAGGRWRKAPLSPHSGHVVRATRRRGVDLDHALASVWRHGADGIGRLLDPQGHVVCLDLDGAIAPGGAIVSPMAKQLGTIFGGGFWEISPSGRGAHLWLVTDWLPAQGVTRDADLEVHAHGGFATVTGILPIGRRAMALRDNTAAFRDWYRDRFRTRSMVAPAELSAAAFAALTDDDQRLITLLAGTRPRFARLFVAGDLTPFGGDDSRADMAVVGFLAWRSDDPDQIARCWRASAHTRRRPDPAKLCDPRYLARTIGKAMQSVADQRRSFGAAPAPFPTARHPDEPGNAAFCPPTVNDPKSSGGVASVIKATKQETIALAVAADLVAREQSGAAMPDGGWAINVAALAAAAGATPETVRLALVAQARRGRLERRCVRTKIGRRVVATTFVTPIGGAAAFATALGRGLS